LRQRGFQLSTGTVDGRFRRDVLLQLSPEQAVTPDTRSKWLAIMNAARAAKGENIRDYLN
jgi:hypothetical protein